VADKPDVDLERARAWLVPFIEQDHHKVSDDVRSLAAEFRAVRLDEARWWFTNRNVNIAIKENRIRKLEASK
jgi:hypothetical protein